MRSLCHAVRSSGFSARHSLCTSNSFVRRRVDIAPATGAVVAAPRRRGAATTATAAGAAPAAAWRPRAGPGGWDATRSLRRTCCALRDCLDRDGARRAVKRSGVAKRRPRHPLPRPRTRSQKPTRPLACTTPPPQSPTQRWSRSGAGSRWGEAGGACTATATNPPTIPHRPTLATSCNEAGSGCPAARHAAAVWRRQASIEGF